MPDLVSLSELKTFLGVTDSADDTLLTDILEHVEALFESETGRAAIPFVAGANRTEVKDGTGDAALFLDYPISTLTSVKVGYDPAAPIESLDVADKNVLTFAVGSRRIARTDGGSFGWPRQPRYVQVVYTHQNELPEDAQLAVKSVCAVAYRRRGAEESTKESAGGYARELVGDLSTSDPFWAKAVAAHRRLILA